MTLFFRFLVNHLINRVKKRAEGRKGSSVVTVLPLLRSVFMIMIWGFAIIAVSETLGFNVGAILDENPETTNIFVEFRDFNSYSFVFSVRYVIKNFSSRHSVRTIIHAEIAKRFRENHIEFAVMPNLNVEQQNPCGDRKAVSGESK